MTVIDNVSMDELPGALDATFSNNCDRNRPYTDQQPLRSQLVVTGLTRRDIQDCMVLGIMECKPTGITENPPSKYVSKEGNEYFDLATLIEAGDTYDDQYIDPEHVSWDDLYGWNLDEIDPVAAVQNMAVHLERRMGIYPALLDGELTVKDTSE